MTPAAGSPRPPLSGAPGSSGLVTRVPAGLVLCGAGTLGALLAAALAPGQARAAAGQDWPPFVLVAGLLLVGLVADEDRLFSAAGQRLAGITHSAVALYAGAVLLISTVTAALNLDTAVAFLTPVLIYTARGRGGGETALLYGCLLLSNAASLLLPGSNLTNLIVLGHLHLSGARFAARMAPAWLAAVVVTAAVVGVAERRGLRTRSQASPEPIRPVVGSGLVAVAAATVLVVLQPNPALPVAAVGVVAVGVRSARRQKLPRRVAEILGVPVLVGLFGLAVALGTAGRDWTGPTTWFSHLDPWSTAPVAAVVALLVNNLPAASLLAARAPRHPFALLVGLNLGPNLFVTGSLAWIVWLRSAQNLGVRPSIRHASRLGAIAVPLSMGAALGVLSLTRLG